MGGRVRLSVAQTRALKEIDGTDVGTRGETNAAAISDLQDMGLVVVGVRITPAGRCFLKEETERNG